MEAVCMQAMMEHIDREAETVVGVAVDISYAAPTPAGTFLKLRGWVESVGARHATFRVSASDVEDTVSEATIRFAVVPQRIMRARLLRKSNVSEPYETVGGRDE